ncbi:unnamed protein product [Pieris brassicae]|uniref:Uncharacterized protein n=1 Tax=Pieris brassicae TaxID=7116 RepID=A0A9P0TI73_PIEBR|nr:unnamed protein product [Pieris brassicae]
MSERAHKVWTSCARDANVHFTRTLRALQAACGAIRDLSSSLFIPPRKAEGKKSKGTGKGASETYISRWFAYDALKFLDDRNTPRKRKNTESLHRSDLENIADQNVFTPPVLPNECTPKSANQTRRDDNVLSDVMGILKTTANKLDNSIGIPDTTKSFASFIGAKMTSYSPQTRTSVENSIFEIITKAEGDITNRGVIKITMHMVHTKMIIYPGQDRTVWI